MARPSPKLHRSSQRPQSPPTANIDIKVTDDEDEDMWVSTQVPPPPAGGIQQDPQTDSDVIPQENENQISKVMPLEGEQSNLRVTAPEFCPQGTRNVRDDIEDTRDEEGVNNPPVPTPGESDEPASSPTVDSPRPTSPYPGDNAQQGDGGDEGEVEMEDNDFHPPSGWVRRSTRERKQPDRYGQSQSLVCSNQAKPAWEHKMECLVKLKDNMGNISDENLKSILDFLHS